MRIHNVEVVHPTHQISIPFLFELMLFLTSKCMSHAYIVRHTLSI
ncbi:hypothetical protein F383_13007 [Gossypium arboreum]|uniref:Uncharacterized protein n=1 Tax=Gossypium arboreum TaxID=29729 RepID=A0A0B0NJS4_GOSAR|nr:hypothetical protein F383_13007 [Gossypium arboreum]